MTRTQRGPHRGIFGGINRSKREPGRHHLIGPSSKKAPDYAKSSIQMPLGSLIYAHRLVGVFMSRTIGWPALLASAVDSSGLSTWTAKWSSASHTVYSFLL